MLSKAVPTGIPHPKHSGFVRRMRKTRLSAGMHAAGLAAAAGLGKPVVGRLERGEGIPLISTAEKLADALKVSPGWLVYGLASDWEPATELRCKGLAARLRQVRDELGLSLADVGKHAGSSGAAVLAVERKTLPTIASLENLATALGVSPAWLAFGELPRELPRRSARRADRLAAPDPAAGAA